jgi:hypothetical protein
LTSALKIAVNLRFGLAPAIGSPRLQQKKPQAGWGYPLEAFLLTTFRKRISMVSSKKVGVMLLNLLGLNEKKPLNAH